jgi:Ca2+-binding RTX toxin-like protein
MRIRGLFICMTAAGLLATPALAHGMLGAAAGAAKDCTITGTAANDDLVGTTKDDVICSKAGTDDIAGREGNDVLRAGQGDDFVSADDGSDVVRGQQDDDDVCGNDQNDRIYGGQGDDLLGAASQCVLGSQGDASPGPNNQGETGNDFLKSRDNVSGNDTVDGGENTDTCRIDAGDVVRNCEL